MKFLPTPLQGAYILELERREDDRGFFARSYCEKEFQALGLVARVAQCNIAHNAKRGTVRGMHWRAEPSPEAKVVRAISGAIWDVIVDLNRDSPSYLKSFGIELSAENRRSLYVPPMFAHGFQTLRDHSDVLYMMSEFYDPSYDRGMRWDDPSISVTWPIDEWIINERDRSYPDFADE